VSEEELRARIAELEEEVRALEATRRVLMARVKQSVDRSGDAWSLFETNIHLQQTVDAHVAELEASNRTLAREVTRRQRATDAAEAASAAKSEFLARVSHEIRTPLNAILGITDLLASQDRDPGIREDLGLIASAGAALLHLVNEVLDLSKVEAGSLELTPEAIDLAEVVEEVIRLHAPTARAKGVELTHALERSGPGPVLGDAGRIHQVLSNLVSNALKFTEEGSIRVELTWDPGEDGPVARIAVQDTGIGIPSDKHDHVFERFTQAEATTTRRFGGTGLGLAICRELLTLMDGTISVASTPGRGSTFSVRIPLPRADGAALSSPRAPSRPDAPETDPDGPADRALRVLVAEDNAVNQRVARRMLEHHGCRVEIAGNGREALAVLAREPVDVVFLDVMMPEMDGCETVRRIRREARYDDLPVIAMTANVMPEDRLRYTELGMNDVVAKPISIDAIGAALERWGAGGRPRAA